MIGGSAGINAVISMANAKAGAIFLGPEGVGLKGLYAELFSLLRIISGLGINSSGVRQVAAASGTGDQEKIGRTIRVLRRVCWATGIGGWIIAAALAWPISQWVFGNHEHALAIGVIGSALLFGALSGGQIALVQGMRRIADLAKFNVVSALLSTIVAILCYWQLGLRGIAPAMIFGAAITLVNSWWFARRIEVPDSQEIGFVQALRQSKELLSIGAAMMWSGALASAAILVRKGMIVSVLGLAAAGYYNAAWTITGIFSTVVLGAMGTDYYPRLCSVSHDHKTMRKIVNEQTEVAILLMLPLLVATLAFAPLAIRIFYSQEFLAAADLLQWFVLGIFGRAVAWPLSYVMLALGKSVLFTISDTLSVAIHLTLAITLLHVIGLVGIPIAFFLHHILYTIAMLLITRSLIGHAWSKAIYSLIATSCALIGLSFLARQYMLEIPALFAGVFLVMCSGIYSLRGLSFRLGSGHRLIRTASRLPGVKWLLGHKRNMP
jgi:PST family polysaccharide transporter